MKTNCDTASQAGIQYFQTLYLVPKLHLGARSLSNLRFETFSHPSLTKPFRQDHECLDMLWSLSLSLDFLDLGKKSAFLNWKRQCHHYENEWALNI